MIHDFRQCGILTSVDSDEPVKPPFKRRNSKFCSFSKISCHGSYCCDCRFLREEQLEMQVWVSYGSRKGDEQRPKHRDKLIGSAYISLEPLSDERRKQHRVRYGIILVFFYYSL